MSRHLVALTGEYESLNHDGSLLHRGIFVYSGFVLCFHGRWYWTTAGHCLQTIDDALRRGQLRFTDCGFADYFGPNATHIHTIPYGYEAGCGVYVRKPGLDIGVIPLDEPKKKLLERNGIIPVSRENWIHQSKLDFLFYKILGFPSHLVQQSTRQMQAVMISVDPVDPSVLDDVPPHTQFVGRIHPQAHITSIEGMSGGPIYGFRVGEQGRLLYHVVAIQSRWRPKSGIVFGCSVPLVAEAIHTALADDASESAADTPAG